MGLFGKRKKTTEDNVHKVVNARGSVGDLTAVAEQLRNTALQQVEAAREAMGSSGGGGPSWVRRFGSLLAGPQAGYVKRCQCTNCGAPKKLPSTNAYVYCDYCGSLADYDLHRACETDTMPGPEYTRLVNGLQPQLKAARAAGDSGQYRDLQRQVFAAWVENVPKAVSHRAKGDDTYRERLIAYLAECGVDRAFDPEATRLEQEMTQRVAALRWTGSLTDRQVAADSFWPMTDTLARQIEVHDTLSTKTGTSDLDPDKAPFIQSKLAWSMFCQGWLARGGSSTFLKMLPGSSSSALGFEASTCRSSPRRASRGGAADVVVRSTPCLAPKSSSATAAAGPSTSVPPSSPAAIAAGP
jgi:hypothetical protein